MKIGRILNKQCVEMFHSMVDANVLFHVIRFAHLISSGLKSILAPF